ncbi:TPA: hypothetical protein I4G93_25680 [Enterobacter hormaechei subsp. xiangfangensis]|uniref:hypothetical protein n=1 Tax=Enterobacter hormaechei TaxID=158836 RepID=UPI000698B4A3|nr:hypothetical protein [Enterobacter hormaechei]HAS1807610.1 hypothetical protein [Enterobacter hormaechei subsp. xiangfangensis]HAS1823619.1 hypothetical protein [Enterobacter hormaechei subsp. xiangfangensis]HAS1829035.1 hypothetical protein [Enterobacter hormaechei subsp. xiangfangensis]HAS1868591.1 hypothetical protein [Enterobacter hormaechei subsp. xiangfangensis]HAS1873881.1 hypothetical protein [Enterobacter hormaechei subsp. xiangfangensis]
MKEFKGCKGDWVHHKPHGYQHSVGGWIQSEKGKVCDVAGLDVGREAAFANARLIAAAPDLLEALLSIVNMDYQPTDDESDKVYLKARAAISKALGEE